MQNIQKTLEDYYLRLQAHPKYLQVMTLPTLQRWGVLAGLFLASQILVFGSLYLIFGKIVVIGFFASVLAAAPPASVRCRLCFLKTFPTVCSTVCSAPQPA